MIEYRTAPAAHSEHTWTIDAVVQLGDGAQELGGCGNGPIAALVDALGPAIGMDVRVIDYAEHALTGGADAAAIAYVEVALADDIRGLGIGRHHDIVTASLRALMSAVVRARRDASVGCAA